MADVFSYIDWRGDLIFKKSMFNEVDNLIFSILSYCPFDGILAANEDDVRKGLPESLSLFEAADRFYTKHTMEEVEKMPTSRKRGANILFAMSKVKRFRDVIICDYVSVLSDEAGQQFSAVTFDLLTDAMYVAFRGTDDSVVGWKEDFYIGISSHIPSQVSALNYFKAEAIKNPRRKFFIGGHSKGGNLAVYAATECNKRLKNRIIRVYNNDGPGFRKEFIERDVYKDILPKVRTIVPEDSIIGMLLEHEEEYTVVRSTASGGMQHNGFTWEVLGKHFIYLEDTSKQSKRVQKIIKEWLEGLPNDKFKIAVDTMFDMIWELGMESFEDVKTKPMKKAYDALRDLSHMDEEKKKIVKDTIKLLLKSGTNTVWQEIPNPFEKDEISED